MALVARRGSRIDLTGEAAGWHTNPVYLDLATGLPYTFHEEGGFFAYLTPCCYNFATASDPQWGIYCKRCFENVPDLCGTGPDREGPDEPEAHEQPHQSGDGNKAVTQ